MANLKGKVHNKYEVHRESAYEAAVRCGFKGTMEEWLESLKDGAVIVNTVLKGQDANGGNIYEQTFRDNTKKTFTAPKGDKGDKGDTGATGASAFEIAVSNGGSSMEGVSESEWLASLKGDKGADAVVTDAEVVQTIGDSENAVMSQAATTAAIGEVKETLVNQAIKETVSGNVLHLKNSIEAPIQKLVVTPNNASVLVSGKNIFNLSKNSALWKCVDNGDGTITAQINGANYCAIETTYLNDYLLTMKGEAITFSCDGVPNDKKCVMVLYGTRNGVSDTQTIDGTVGNNYVTGIVAEDFSEITCLAIRPIASATEFEDMTTVLSNFMLEFNDEATEFEPCKLQISPQGNFDGLSTYYPTTNIIPSVSANIECTYCVDAKKYIDAKYNPIEIPSYWGNAVSEAIEFAKAKKYKGYTNYLVLTDVHSDPTNKATPNILNYLYEKDLFNKIMILGDMVDENNQDYAYSRLINSGLIKHRENILFVRGNHDYKCGTPDTFYDFMRGKDVVFASDEILYCWHYDDNASKVRYIGIDWHPNYPNVNLNDWVTSTVANIPNGYAYCFIMHHTLQSANSNWEGCYEVYIENLLLNIVDTTNNDFIGFITGHQHLDECVQLPNGTFHTTLMCDYFDEQNYYSYYDYPTRTVGTDSEGAITIMSVNPITKDVRFYRVGSCCNSNYKSWGYNYSN